MAQTAKTDKDRWYEKGFTRVPNAVIADETVLSSADKLVILVLSMYAWGDKVEVYPSQRLIAAQSRLNRRTVRTSLERLTALRIAEEVGRDARNKVTYRLNLGVDWSTSTPVIGAPMHHKNGLIGALVPTNKKQHKTYHKDASRRAASSLSDAEMTSGDSVDGSAASPESAVPSEIEVSTSPEVHGIGQSAEPATPPGHNGRNMLLSRDIADEILDEEVFGTGSDATPQGSAESEPERPCSKLQERRIAPDGTSFYDSVADGEAWLEAVKVLKQAGGEPFNHGALQESIEEHGEACVWFHAKWFLLRLAARSEPPDKPAPFFLDCIAKDYRVNLKWLDLVFNRVRHGCFTEEQRKELPADAAPFKEDEIEDCFGGSVTTFNDDTKLPEDSEASQSADEADLDYAF
jgi:hypothetical protein